MRKFWKISNWSKIEKTLEQKPNILLSQFAIIGILVCIIQVLHDALYMSLNAVLFDLLILLPLAIAYWLNERRHHKAAKAIFTIFGTGTVFIFAAIIPKETGVYLVFYPLVLVAYLIYNNERLLLKYLSILYVMGLLAILEITNYHPFGVYNVTDSAGIETSFYVNMVTSMLALVVAIYNMDKINREIAENRQKISNELSKKNDALAKANEELDHFVYSASHDLKAPLSSILGLVNLAKHELKDPNTLIYFEKIESSVSKLSRFIKDIIDLSRNARKEVEKQEVHFDELLNNVIENNKYMVHDDKIRFEKHVSFNNAVKVDRARTEVILNNLISNAIKYKDADKEQHVINIEIDRTEYWLTFIVKDNGVGIKEEYKERVFDMFFRAHHTSEGSGLGLYIVGNVIEKLQGNIELHSEENVGTTVKVTLPL